MPCYGVRGEEGTPIDPTMVYGPSRLIAYSVATIWQVQTTAGAWRIANCYKYASLSSCVNTISNRSITPNLYGFRSLTNVVGLYAYHLRTWLTQSANCRLSFNVAMKYSGELLLRIVVVAVLFLCEPGEVAAQGKAEVDIATIVWSAMLPCASVPHPSLSFDQL